MDTFIQDPALTPNTDDSHLVMTVKVQHLAGSIYQEFEKMIAKYDEGVVKDLMPLVVNVLESLDISFMENQEHEVEIELLKEDNEQLVTQYEREKQLRKAAEQKLLEVEYSVDEEKRDLHAKLESLESILRMLEKKAKTSSDHAVRLEEKEVEMKKEYSKLHDRYTELFKTHMEYMERTKILFGTDRLEGPRSRVPSVCLYPKPEGGHQLAEAPVHFVPGSHELDLDGITPTAAGPDEALTPVAVAAPSIHNTPKKGGWVEGFENELSDVIISTPETEDIQDISRDPTVGMETSRIKKEFRRPNTLYQELSFQDADALGEMDEGSDITGGYVHPGEYSSLVTDNFFGMGKEVENLIMENNELLETKNALNIVKDDLIAKVDELTSELEILREEVKTYKATKERHRQRMGEMEEEIRKLREEAEKAKAPKSDDEQEEGPLAQRKRFTRVEMARILLERNQYKERLMELQDAVRMTEMIRASKNSSEPNLDPKKSRSSIWKFFGHLFSPHERPPSPHTKPHPLRPLDHGGDGPRSSALETMRKKRLGDHHRHLDFLDSGDLGSEKLTQQRARERQTQFKNVRAYVSKDGQGRLRAYGWSLPTQGEEGGDSKPSSSNVPVPVYCKPLMDSKPGLKVWCATGIDLSGGRTTDNTEPTQGLSSQVWVGASEAGGSSCVLVLDSNHPSEVLEFFSLAQCSDLLAMVSVPGARLGDTPADRIVASQSSEEEEPRVGAVTLMALPREAEIPESSGMVEKMSTELPTVWIGTQDGKILIHSAVAQRKRTIHCLQLKDSVLSICHVRGAVLAALSNGTVAVFHRALDGQWDVGSYHVVTLGTPHHWVRCLEPVGSHVWCGYRNRIHVLDPTSLLLLAGFEAHPREESQVRQMATLDAGVWVTIRLDSTLRLYHALSHQHLQDVDVDPYVSKMLGTGRLGFSLVRITSLLIHHNRMWMGTGNGVVISVPLVTGEGNTAANIPYCSMALAQLSFHGHKDAVTFFVAVPGENTTSSSSSAPATEKQKDQPWLLLSGGEGYVDFRIGDGEESRNNPAQDQLSHLIVWQVLAS